MHWISKHCIKCFRILYCHLCPDKEQELQAMLEGEVADVEVEMNWPFEDIPVGLILEDEETPVLETETKTLLGTITKPPTEERGGAMQGVA